MKGILAQHKPKGASPQYWADLFRDFDIDDKVTQFKGNELYAVLKENIAPKQKALDAGCGTGKITFAFLQDHYAFTGIDFSKDIIQKVKEFAPAYAKHFAVMDVRQLKFADFSFDIYLSPGVVEHFSADEQKLILLEARRVLKHDGRLILIVPYINLIGKIKLPFNLLKESRKRGRGAEFYQYRYTKAAVKLLLQNNGFVPEKMYLFGLHDTKLFDVHIIPKFLRKNHLLLALFATTICVVCRKK